MPPDSLPRTTEDRALAPEVRAPADDPGNAFRLLAVVAVSIALGVVGGLIAKALLTLIALINGAVFRGRLEWVLQDPTTDALGHWVMVVPVVGAVIIGFMAKFGSAGIRGHGIPEVMERVLYGESRISPRLMVLKPLSAAIAIGTGGPFGAEGPIIATGGALGSFIGQGLRVTSEERKVLLAAGAAAGMSATFGTPVAAVLLAVELLLFEYRARSIVPVALASSAAMAIRTLLIGTGAVFEMPALAEPTYWALMCYVVLGAALGFSSVLVSRAVYVIEDGFERLPIHWMWWPALGAVVVGVAGWIDPRILGVGYGHIDAILSARVVGASLLALVALKFIAWSIYLGSGTSGGTLAPLFIIGGGLGSLLGTLANQTIPGLQLSIPVAALVGMAAMFAGASHALLASIVFAFEATQQPLGLLPLLAGCSASYLVAVTMRPTSIMTERLARRGALVRPEYEMDFLGRVLVRDAMTREVVTLPADTEVGAIRTWLESPSTRFGHQGFPVVAQNGALLGVITRREIVDPTVQGATKARDLIRREPSVVHPDNTLRDAADHMLRENVGRLPVVERGSARTVVGIITRSDLLAAHEPRLRGNASRERVLFTRGARVGPEGGPRGT